MNELTEINAGYEALLETPEQECKRKKAIAASPDITKLSKPYVTDNGRTLVYFKAGADVETKGAIFEEHRGRIDRVETKVDKLLQKLEELS